MISFDSPLQEGENNMMTIKPVKTYTPPAYPTYEESKQDAHLLERLPRRWGKTLAPLLGTGILIQIVGTGCSQNDTQGKGVKITAVEPLGQKPKNVADAVRAIPATRVAPILEDALANDGRGGFGCVAVSAPVFLSEDEAIDLIRAELEKAGLALQTGVSVDGLQVPTTSAKNQWKKMKRFEEIMRKERPDLLEKIFKTKCELNEKEDENKNPAEIAVLRVEFTALEEKYATLEEELKEILRDNKLGFEEGSYRFDLGTKNQSVVVKFLQWEDYPINLGWSVIRFDLAKLATQMGDAFKARTNGNPVVIGLFFDPLTYPKDFSWAKLDGLSGEQRNVEYEKIRKDTEKISREKLRRQVQHFVEYLKKEGVVQ